MPTKDFSTYGALVEVNSAMPDARIQELLAAAYRASRRRPSAILLRELSTREADRILDPVVSAVGREAAGLVYLAEDEEDDFVRAARRAAIIVVSTGGLRDRLVSNGLNPLPPREGIRALRRCAGVEEADAASSRMMSAGG